MANKKDLRLTSVNVLNNLYSEFKAKTITGGLTLKQLVNRSMWLYLNDSEFYDGLNSITALQVSGSHF